MAGADSTQPGPASAKEELLALQNEATRSSRQLEALLHSIAGGGFHAFCELNDEHRENPLWLASDLGKRVRVATDGLVDRPALVSIVIGDSK